ALSVRFASLHVFLVLIGRRPPGSSLSPYTTLFRSAGRGIIGLDSAADGHGCESRTGSEGESSGGESDFFHFSHLDCLFVARSGLDRKSTRLNSSHVKNSYAVFCLKKKKHNAQLV